MNFFRKRRHQRFALVSLVGILMLASAFHILSWTNIQVEEFNAGLATYEAAIAPPAPGQPLQIAAADAPHPKEKELLLAVQQFDRSLAAYRNRVANENHLYNYIYPPPDRGLAARAAFQKAKALLALKQPAAALEAFKESLMLNPGNGYTNVALAEAQRLEREARVTQYNLELLFSENENLAKKEGSSKEQGEPNKPEPGNQPGTMPGQGGDPSSI